MQRVLLGQNFLSSLKRKWERFQENFIAKCSLKNSWANTCKSIKSSSMDLHYNILLLKREFFFYSSYSMRLVKRLWVSCCKASEHKGWVVPVWFRLCKGFYKDSGTLKWVAWGLDVGTRVWPNQYKSEFAFSLPLNSFIYYCFIFIFKLFYLNQYLRNSLLREFITWIES